MYVCMYVCHVGVGRGWSFVPSTMTVFVTVSVTSFGHWHCLPLLCPPMSLVLTMVWLSTTTLARPPAHDNRILWWVIPLCNHETMWLCIVQMLHVTLSIPLALSLSHTVVSLSYHMDDACVCVQPTTLLNDKHCTKLGANVHWRLRCKVNKSWELIL